MGCTLINEEFPKRYCLKSSLTKTILQLYRLAPIEIVCIFQSLVTMVGATDEILQEASAGCLANIRKLALANEKATYA